MCVSSFVDLLVQLIAFISSNFMHLEITFHNVVSFLFDQHVQQFYNICQSACSLASYLSLLDVAKRGAYKQTPKLVDVNGVSSLFFFFQIIWPQRFCCFLL